MLQKKMRRKIEEVLGGLTIIRVGHGIKVRRSKGPNRKQVLESPAFENSRTTLNDFLTASKDSKSIRDALQDGIVHITDNRKHLRLNSAIRKITREHGKSMHGQRNLLESGPQRLRGFEFNGRNGLSNTLKAHYQVDIDRAAGKAAVTVPGFSPLKHLRVPQGATHVRLHAVVAAIDFTKRKHKSVSSLSIPLDVNEMTAADVKLEMILPPAGNDPLFLGVGVYFVQYLHGVEYKLDNSDYSAFMLAAVDVAPDGPADPDGTAKQVIASIPENDAVVVGGREDAALVVTPEVDVENTIAAAAEPGHHPHTQEALPIE
ncbi:hypothetical protein [uncultured Chitinophaga sp.]|uniref:hypothetical protein n=1 Tax=uncultured Chitinophaga sp. TaxID=339340 RepID=UPI0025CC1FF9|nr:hypothetical protein [uncultured Chitinophaga sp.]